MNVDILISLIAEQTNISLTSVRAVVSLLDSGATIPFIARYRKEATQSLDEVQIADIQSTQKKIKEIHVRKAFIQKTILDQGKLTSELKIRIEKCWDAVALEDIYLPYKVKRKTRAEMARKNGLEPLAKILMSQRHAFPDREAKQYIRGSVKSLEGAYSGARDIMAEWINENTYARENIRKLFKNKAIIQSKLVKKYEQDAVKYRDYFDYASPLRKCPSHRILAIRRAEKEGYLRIHIRIDDDLAKSRLGRIFIKTDNESADQVREAIVDSYKRLLAPAIENEFKKISKEKADAEAIEVFSKNVTQLLLASPAGAQVTLGIDPGYRTGCKVVILNAMGDLLQNKTIYPHPPQNKSLEARELLKQLITKHDVRLIAVGNGTAGRETMSLAQSVVKEQKEIQVFSVNESGASIYSASAIARQEFPDLDLTVRGAISIGRRLMDPLAELVKIDPKSIGVGQYQHDVNQDQLKESLDQVVSLAVNNVGVNLNTASQHLLRYISGIGPKIAQNIIDYRKEHNVFKNRSELKKVKGLGAKAFEQAAGFMRIPTSNNVLDRTSVHPESYPVVSKMARHLKLPVEALIDNEDKIKQIPLEEFVSEKVGLPTLRDIVKELSKPGLDPRGEATTFSFEESIQTIEDLSVGSVLPGIISNLTKFGAFVDLGIKENGLIHISQITDRYITDPAEVLHLDQKVKVEVLSVDIDRKRIQLKMKRS